MAKMKGKIIEKRKATRIKPLLKVRYRLCKRPTLQKAGFVSDISGTGMKICTDERLWKDEHITILFDNFQKRGIVKILACIRWCRQLGKDKFEAGLEFKNLKNGESFSSWICGKMLNIGFFPG